MNIINFTQSEEESKNKQNLKPVGEEQKQVIFDILENKKESEDENLMQSESFKYFLDVQDINSLLKISLKDEQDKMSSFEIVVPELIRTGRLSKENIDYINDELSILISRDLFPIYTDVFKNVFETGVVNQNNIDLYNRAFSKRFKNIIEGKSKNIDTSVIGILDNIPDGSLIQENIDLLNNNFDRLLELIEFNNYFVWSTIPGLLESGYINDENINKNFEKYLKIFKKNDNFMEYLLPAFTKTGKLNKRNLKKFREIFEQPDLSNKVIINFLKSGYIDEKAINRKFSEQVFYADDLDVYFAFVNTDKLDEINLSTVNDYFINNYYDDSHIDYIIELLESGKIEKNLVFKGFVKLFNESNYIRNYDKNGIMAAYIYTGYITQEYIDKLFNIVKENIGITETKINSERILGALLETGNLDKSKLDEIDVKIELPYVQCKYISQKSKNITGNININFIKKYNENLKLIDEIIDLAPYQNIYIYCRNNFLNLHELKRIKNFLNYDFVKGHIVYYDSDSILKMGNRIDSIQEKKGNYFEQGLYLAYFENHLLSNYGELADNSTEFPISIDNALDYMLDYNILFNSVIDSKSSSFKQIDKKLYSSRDNLTKLIKTGIIGYSGAESIREFRANNPEYWNKLIEFFEMKVLPSRNNTTIFENNKIKQGKNFNKIFAYFLDNKQKTLIKYIQKLNFAVTYDFGIDIEEFESLDNYLDNNGNIDKKGLIKNYSQILFLLEDKQKDKKLRKLENVIDKKDKKQLENILLENMINYFDYLYEKKLRKRVIKELGENLDKAIDVNKILQEKLDNETFIEAFKMLVGTKYNKKPLTRILYMYLIGEFEDLDGLKQYDTFKNNIWLDDNLSQKQQGVWLSENKVIYDVKQEKIDNDGKENIKQKLEDHYEIAIKKIQELNNIGFNLKTNFSKHGELIEYFYKELNRNDEIKQKNLSLFNDLKLQITSMEKLNQNSKSKKADKIVIYKERNPLNSLMMGNWVEGSCLSFYSSIGNFYSSISNTVDVNKGVYYIKNEKGELLARILVTIGEDKKISRYKMYFSGNTNIDLNKYFNIYFRELSKKIGLEKNGDQYKVKKIESDNWYLDGTQEV